MKFYTKKCLIEYLQNDWILEMLNLLECSEDTYFRTHKWMKEMDNKRMIYSDMYGDLLKCEGLSVLDVGGGYTSLTRKLIRNHEYHLLDFMAHGEAERLAAISNENENKGDVIIEDWFDFSPLTNYDIVISNDLFPDADQRLELFIDKFLPYCKEMRLLLTFYNEPKFYTTRRIDDTEILTFLSYDGEVLALKLKKYLERCNATEVEIDSLKKFNESIYFNKRQVCYIVLKGNLAETGSIK